MRRKIRKAVALQYDDGSQAPVVGASGETVDPDELVRMARRMGVPVVEDPALAGALEALQAGDEIPPEMYEAVALLIHSLEQREFAQESE